MRHFRIAACVAAAFFAAAAMRTAIMERGQDPGDLRSVVEADVSERDIAFYEARAARDTAAARDRMQLGLLYLARARATGSHEDLLRSEWWARESVRRRKSRNGAAMVVLAATLMAQHRFREARETAAALVRHDPARLTYRALLGEIELELGNYASADSAFRALPATGDALALGPRFARWHELNGRPAEARRYLVRAMQAAQLRKEMPVEQLAWLCLRLGDLAAGQGNLDGAARHYAAGLDWSPRDHRVLAGQARLELARGRPHRALEAAERSLGETMDPGTLALLSTIQRARGHDQAAADYRRAFDVALANQQGGFHREWTLFELDNGGDAGAAMARAARDTLERRDIYAFDLLAWSLYRAGHHAEAASVSNQALRLHTRDARLHFHAGMIARANADTTGALHHLELALAINPHFDADRARLARATAAALRGRP